MSGDRPTAAQMLRMLREAGYRVTLERRAVVEAVLCRKRQFTGADIVGDVLGRDPSAARATVFRTLEVLAELGLIGRVRQPGGGLGYVLCPRGHHHHAVCSGCGLVLDLPGCPLDPEAGKEAREAGFLLTGHYLEYYGICRSCQERGVS